MVEVLTAEEWGRCFGKQDVRGCHIYNTVQFSELNGHKCSRILYLRICENFGLVAGLRENGLMSPFSAPFAGFVAERAADINDLDTVVSGLSEFVHSRGLKLTVTLPPAIYDPEFIERSEAAFEKYGRLLYQDVNHYYNIETHPDINESMHRLARRKYRTSLEMDFSFIPLSRNSEEDIARAYAVIKANRNAHGYPLRMSLDDVVRTAPLAGAEFGVLTLDGCDVAACQLHRVAPGIFQVVYWGDIPVAGNNGTVMGRLVPEVFRWCREMGAKIVDVGPSSEHGTVSEGLARFKVSQGCESVFKKTFSL